MQKLTLVAMLLEGKVTCVSNTHDDKKDVIVILNLVTAIYNKSSLQHACWKSCSKIDQDRLFGQQKDCSSVSLVIIANNSTVLQQIIALNPRALPLLVLCWAPCHLHSFKIGYLC